MSAITAGTPFSTREMAAAKAHMVALSLMSGTYVFGTCSDKGTVTPFHFRKLEERFVLLLFSQSLPFIFCDPDVTRIIVSQTSW